MGSYSRVQMSSLWPPFGVAVLVGSYGGLAFSFLFVGSEGLSLGDAIAAPLVVAIYGTFVVPFVAAGLALFGLPVLPLLSTILDRGWSGIVAVLWGAGTGKLFMYVVDQTLFDQSYRLVELQREDPGLIFGVTTALCWWALLRRERTSSTVAP
jgi:hypothetical protein